MDGRTIAFMSVSVSCTDLSVCSALMCCCQGGATGPLDPDAKLSVIRQVTEGVSYLHTMKHAHRDVKPNNILVRLIARAKHSRLARACLFRSW